MDDLAQISRWITGRAYLQAYFALLGGLAASPGRPKLAELSRRLSEAVRSRCFDLGSSKATEMSLELQESTALLELAVRLGGQTGDLVGEPGSPLFGQTRPLSPSEVSERVADPIVPTQIEHSVDEVWDGDRLEQRYNYVDYHFERDGAHCRARSYADDFGEVTLFGLFHGPDGTRTTSDPSLERDVRAYLGKRFLKVSRR
jgi:hypothetical protein